MCIVHTRRSIFLVVGFICSFFSMNAFADEPAAVNLGQFKTAAGLPRVWDTATDSTGRTLMLLSPKPGPAEPYWSLIVFRLDAAGKQDRSFGDHGSVQLMLHRPLSVEPTPKISAADEEIEVTYAIASKDAAEDQRLRQTSLTVDGDIVESIGEPQIN